MVLRPFIAGPRIARIGWSSSCRFPTEFPRAIAFVDCRLLIALQPEAFQKCFQDWITDAIQTDDSSPDRLIAIDGKTCRRSHDALQLLGAL